MHEIEELWATHLASIFPKDACREIRGIDLVSLDSYTAGCVDTFLENKGQLDLGRTSILGLCYRDLSIIVPELHSEEHLHFSRLEKLSKLILVNIRDTNKL